MRGVLPYLDQVNFIYIENQQVNLLKFLILF